MHLDAFPPIDWGSLIADLLDVPSKPTRAILPGLFSGNEIAGRFGMTIRAVRERALGTRVSAPAPSAD